MLWRFRDFEIDDIRFELRRAGERVAIAPLPLALLIHLAKRHPATVSREELFETLWPGVRVAKGSLTQTVLLARRALGEDGQEDGAIRTVRGRGYAFGAAFQLDPSSVAPIATSGQIPFVGRETELSQIDAALKDVEGGQGRVLLISGEPGIGKSRLLDELAARAQARGALVVSGQCWQDEGAPPYWPWPEVFRAVRGRCEDVDLRESIDQVLQGVAAAHAERSAKETSHLGFSDADARFRLFLNATESLRQAAGRQMVVVLIEDLHWASPGALNLLHFAGSSLSKANIAIAATYRTSGPPMNPTLERILGELGANAHALTQMELCGFSHDEVATYVNIVTGQVPSEHLVARLKQAAGGNPLFLRELAPIFGVADPAGQNEGSVAIPSSLIQIIRSKIDRLGRSARELVETASVVGRTFAPELLARVSRRKLETVLEYLEEARGEALIEPYQQGHFRFRHDVIRAALFDRLRPIRRIGLHLRIANAIEAGGDQEAHSAELAHHFFQAIPRAGVEKAVHYATIAAESAREALDFDAAAESYGQALAALERGASSPPTQRCDLLLSLGEVLELTGQLAESRQTILEAVKIARALRSYTRLGAAALTMTSWPFRVVADRLASQLVEEALRAIGPRPIALRARLLVKLAVLRRVEGAEADAFQLVDEAVALVERLGDPSLRCDVLLHRLLVFQWGVPANHKERLAISDELLDIADRAGNFYAKLQCRRLRIALFLETSAGTELDYEIERFAEECNAAKCKQHYVAAFRGTRATISGRFEEASRAIDEAAGLADPLSPEEGLFTPISQRIDLPPEYRDSAGIVRTIQRIIHDYPQFIPWRIVLGLVALDIDRTQEARAALEQFSEDDFALVPRDMGSVLVIATLTKLCWRLEEKRYTRQLHELLSPYAGLQVSNAVGVIYQGPVDWHLGVLATMLGRRREASQRFAAALLDTERLGAWPWHAQTQFEYASLLAAGNRTERARAGELAESARDSATQFGMRDLKARAERLAAELSRRRSSAR